MTFYGVWVGKTTGIFTEWRKCYQQIKNVKGAKYKKLKAQNEKEAQKEFDEGFKPNTKEDKKLKKEEREKKSSFIQKDLHKTGELVYFCDGACLDNPSDSGSGISVYRHQKLDALYYGDYTVKGSNNIAELKSIIYCLKKIKEEQPFAAIIYADSQYTISCITKWAAKWKENNWIKPDKKPAKNKELVEEAFELYQDLITIVEIKYVKAHNGEEGNELADRMAITASNTKSKEWKKYDSLNVVEILKIKHNK